MGNDKVIKSALNYTGNKYKLIPQIKEILPKEIDTFYDIFAGSLTVTLNTNAQRYYCNDIVTYVVGLFEDLHKKNYIDVLKDINLIIDKYNLTKDNEDGFKTLKNVYNTDQSKNAILFYVLVCYSFNSAYRFNSKHEYNAGFGKRSFCDKHMRNLEDTLNALNTMDITFSKKDFRDVDYSKATKDDFVYLDPPYIITSSASYNDGKRGFKGWGTQDEKDLLSVIDDLNNRGVRFALSNVLEHGDKENLILKEWASKYKVHEIVASYTNSSHHKRITKSREVLITNY